MLSLIFGNNKATSLPSRNTVRNSERKKKEEGGKNQARASGISLGHDLGG